MMSSSLGGRSGFMRIAGTGSRSRISRKITAELSPRKGNAPVAISYSTAPKENKSLRASTSLARACSGDIYATVPSVEPGLVRCSCAMVSALEFEAAAKLVTAEGDAVEEFHGDEGVFVVLADFVNGADVGMVEGRGGTGFAAEPLERLGVFREIVGKEFQRDEAAELGKIGRAHV